jgi:hypothetical protein
MRWDELAIHKHCRISSLHYKPDSGGFVSLHAAHWDRLETRERYPFSCKL